MPISLAATWTTPGGTVAGASFTDPDTEITVAQAKRQAKDFAKSCGPVHPDDPVVHVTLTHSTVHEIEADGATPDDLPQAAP